MAFWRFDIKPLWNHQTSLSDSLTKGKGSQGFAMPLQSGQDERAGAGQGTVCPTWQTDLLNKQKTYPIVFIRIGHLGFQAGFFGMV